MTVADGSGTTLPQPHGWSRLRGRIGEGVASPRGRLVRQTLVYAAGAMLPQAMSILLLPVFTRYLSASEYGMLAYSLTIGGFFATLGTFAIQPFVVRQYWLARKSGDVGRMLSTVFLFLLVLNVVLLAVALVVLPPLFRLLAVQVPFAPYVQLALCSAALQTMAVVPMSYFRATERPSVYVGLASLASLLGGGLSLYLVAVAGMGIMGRLYGQIAADLVMLAVHLLIMARISRLAWHASYVREAMLYCSPLVPAQFLAMFAGMADRLVLERWVPLAELGLYSVAAAFAATAPLLTSGVFSAIQPTVARMAVDAELDDRILAIKRKLVWLLMLLMCAAIAFSRDAIAIVAGPTFHDSYKVAALLIPAILVQSFITNVPSQYLMAIGKTQFEMPSRLAGAVAGLVAMLVLVPILGIYGAGVASIVTALATLGGYARVLKRLPIGWRFGRDLVRLAAAAVVGVLICQIQLPNPALSVGSKVVLVAVVTVAYLTLASASVRGALASIPMLWPVQRS